MHFSSLTKLQKRAFIFGVVFLIVFVITNVPAFNDAEGRNFGLFKIDPIDNVVHLLTAILGFIAAWKSPQWSKVYLLFFGVLYGLDALAGIFLQRGLLDLTAVTEAGGTTDLGITNLLISAPHVGISLLMIWAGFVKDRAAVRS
jgi:hypothetical protein